MDVGGSSQPNEHEKRASRWVWTKEEEEALLENLATNVDLDENSENDVEMLGNFSPMSVNQIESTQRGLNQASSQPSSRKRSRSGDPIIRSMDRFTNVLKEAMDKTNETLDKFAQVLAKNKVNENSLLATDLQKMQLPLADQIRIMQKFMQKPEIAEVFKAQSNEDQKFQFIASILSGAFDG
ncbi:hypothetical protein JRO89_XS01G0198100 [Xanthoceras sorbifolium]|uniref:Uncharacterized protein n=1 Tax=Xanthoceras sorbifolium TaxID=99658 RepID=A0ABQ8IK29_9ROSI|nr:hypothetical protein JRO89_XS01G0198100 [Xanthoceras sorbifolium]